MRVLFIKEFLSALENPDVEMFVIDEVGWGRPLRSYGYAIIGEPLIIKYHKKLPNITCTCCISKHGIEGLKFFTEGGTTNEYFSDYFADLLDALKQKYKGKTLLFV